MAKSYTILNTKTLKFGTAEIRSDGILTFEPRGDASLHSLAELKDMLKTFKELTNGKPHLYYSNNNNIKGNFSSEEKAYMSAHFHEFATAFAMTENSALVRFITHTFIYLNKPQIPIKMFKTKETAIEWLKSL